MPLAGQAACVMFHNPNLRGKQTMTKVNAKICNLQVLLQDLLQMAEKMGIDNDDVTKHRKVESLLHKAAVPLWELYAALEDQLEDTEVKVDEPTEWAKNNHYFISSALEWRAGTDLIDMLIRMRAYDNTGYTRWVGANIYLVPLNKEAEYDINYYQPQTNCTYVGEVKD